MQFLVIVFTESRISLDAKTAIIVNAKTADNDRSSEVG